jgi:hypothetical protein
MLFAAAHESAYGTKLPIRNVGYSVAIGAKTDVTEPSMRQVS